MPNSNDSLDYTTCCCNCHVRKFATVIGYITAILSVLPSLTIFMGNPSAIASIISFVCGIYLIFADTDENPSYYLPYLIYTGMCLVGTTLMFFVVVIHQLITTKSTIDAFLCVVLLSIYPFFAILHSYFWYVVKRAREYMKNEIRARKNPPSTDASVQVMIIEKV